MSSKPLLTDDECDRFAQALLSHHEFFRDPIHGDISVTLLERTIIDQPIFQRLRNIRQLGPTHFAYHGATHNRFQHCLGTLHLAEQIVQISNKNAESFANANAIAVRPYARLLARLLALHHDIAHIPFGHTLEREGNLFHYHEWEDAERAKTIFDQLEPKIKDFVIRTGAPGDFADILLADLHSALTNPKSPMAYRIPFILDIVQNTLCADLLDYVERDMLFCGLKERVGDRFLRYLAIIPLAEKVSATTSKSKQSQEEFGFLPSDKGGKGRVVLLTYRYERDRDDPRRIRAVEKIGSVVSEAVNLLRLRYSLAERVYFHRTKIAASAMIISAVYSAKYSANELFKTDDAGLLARLRQEKIEKVKRIAGSFERRNLYKPAYKIEFSEEDDTRPDSVRLWNDIYPSYRTPAQRENAEQQLEKEMDLPPGTVVIYCPERGMNLKQFEMLVQPSPQASVKPLRGILDPLRRAEMDVIENSFRRLWHLLVLVDPEVLDPAKKGDPRVREFVGQCETLFGRANAIDGLSGFASSYAERLLHRLVAEWDVANPLTLVPHQVVQDMKATKYRPMSLDELRQQMRIDLRAKMEPYRKRSDTSVSQQTLREE